MSRATQSFAFVPALAIAAGAVLVGCVPGYVAVGGSYRTSGYYDYDSAEVQVHRPPPAAVFEYRAPAPGPGHLWVDGYWDWNGYDWFWLRGYWVSGRPGYVFVRPNVVAVGGRWVYRRGYWQGQGGQRDYQYARPAPPAPYPNSSGGWRGGSPGAQAAPPAQGWQGAPPAYPPSSSGGWRGGPPTSGSAPPARGWQGGAPSAATPPAYPSPGPSPPSFRGGGGSNDRSNDGSSGGSAPSFRRGGGSSGNPPAAAPPPPPAANAPNMRRGQPEPPAQDQGGGRVPSFRRSPSSAVGAPEPAPPQPAQDGQGGGRRGKAPVPEEQQ